MVQKLVSKQFYRSETGRGDSSFLIWYKTILVPGKFQNSYLKMHHLLDFNRLPTALTHDGTYFLNYMSYRRVYESLLTKFSNRKIEFWF